MGDALEASPETEVSGEVVDTIEVDGVPCDADKARDAVRRCVNAIIVLRKFERRFDLFPDGMQPVPPRMLREFTRELDRALTGELDAETNDA